MADSATVTFEELQRMRRRGETLDGIFIETEEWINRAELILKRADSLRKHIELIRLEHRPVNGADSVDDDVEQRGEEQE